MHNFIGRVYSDSSLVESRLFSSLRARLSGIENFDSLPMAAVPLHYPGSLIPSSFPLLNQSLLDVSSEDSDGVFHVWILITIWIVLVVTIVFGTIGNLLVLYIYLNRKDDKTCSFFIQMLAVVDLLICSLLAPLELYQTTTGKKFIARPCRLIVLGMNDCAEMKCPSRETPDPCQILSVACL